MRKRRGNGSTSAAESAEAARHTETAAENKTPGNDTRRDSGQRVQDKQRGRDLDAGKGGSRSEKISLETETAAETRERKKAGKLLPVLFSTYLISYSFFSCACFRAGSGVPRLFI